MPKGLGGVDANEELIFSRNFFNGAEIFPLETFVDIRRLLRALWDPSNSIMTGKSNIIFLCQLGLLESYLCAKRHDSSMLLPAEHLLKFNLYKIWVIYKLLAVFQLHYCECKELNKII